MRLKFSIFTIYRVFSDLKHSIQKMSKKEK